MKRLKMSPEEWEAESLKLHDLRQERSKVALLAVEEMLKHPLSAEQMRAQIRQHHAEADRLEKAFAKREQRKNSNGTGAKSDKLDTYKKGSRNAK
jgi:hypothetical protein